MTFLRRGWTGPAAGLALATGIGVLIWVAVVSFRDEPSSPSRQGTGVTAAPSTGGGQASSLSDFADVGITITGTDGVVRPWCLLAARTGAEHARGLMRVVDPTLGGRDGMLFTFADDREGGFWMRNTPMPLEIAYFDRRGEVVSTAAMEPCADDPDCPSYPPAAPYRSAIEVPRAAGGLRRLGIAPGARLTVTGRCTPAP